MVNFKNIAVVATALFSCALGAPVAEDDGTFHITGEKGSVIEGSYIVTLKPGVKAQQFESHLTWVEDVHKRNVEKRGSEFKGVQRKYNGKYGFKGYSGHFDEETLKELKESPDVSLSTFNPHIH